MDDFSRFQSSTVSTSMRGSRSLNFYTDCCILNGPARPPNSNVAAKCWVNCRLAPDQRRSCRPSQLWRDSKPTPSTPGAALPDSSDWPNAAQAPQTNYSMRKQNCDKSTLSSAAVQEAEVERIDDQLGKHPIGKCRPQGRSPPLEQRRGLVEFPTLLLDTPNPRLAHAKVRRNFPSASPPVARCEHLATELFRIRFYRHLLECACITQPSQMALDLCQMRSRRAGDARICEPDWHRRQQHD